MRGRPGSSALRSTWALMGLVSLLLGLSVEARAYEQWAGPLPARNFQPIQLLFLGMFGDRAVVLKPGHLDVRLELANTSSIFREETNPPFFALVRATMKMEQLRSGLFLRYGLTERMEVGVEVPVLYRYAGVMEGLITGVERATSGVTGARKQLGQVNYAYLVSRNGQPLFTGASGDMGLGDVSVVGKYQLMTQEVWRPAVSLRVAVKTPSGDSRRLFGSGHPDIGLGLAIDQRVADRWMLYANVNGVFPTGSVSGLALHPALSGLAGAEYSWSSRLSWTAQFNYFETPFHGTGIKLLDRSATEVAAGFNYWLRRTLLWQVYAVENVDFISGGAADFTLSTVMTYRFGR
jgi:hypothetical protein